MSFPKKSTALVIVFASLVALVTSGCNTAQGFGKDIEKAGDKIQDKASR